MARPRWRRVPGNRSAPPSCGRERETEHGALLGRAGYNFLESSSRATAGSTEQGETRGCLDATNDGKHVGWGLPHHQSPPLIEFQWWGKPHPTGSLKIWRPEILIVIVIGDVSVMRKGNFNGLPGRNIRKFLRSSPPGPRHRDTSGRNFSPIQKALGIVVVGFQPAAATSGSGTNTDVPGGASLPGSQAGSLLPQCHLPPCQLPP